jgi:hypothetical protein
MSEPLSRAPSRPPTAPAVGEYEYRLIVLPRYTSRAEAIRLLTDHAEYGHWELARVQVFMGGARKAWLRRRILRVARTA